MNTAKMAKRAERLNARLARIDYLLERGGADKAGLEKEKERRNLELAYLESTLEARAE